MRISKNYFRHYKGRPLVKLKLSNGSSINNPKQLKISVLVTKQEKIQQRTENIKINERKTKKKLWKIEKIYTEGNPNIPKKEKRDINKRKAQRLTERPKKEMNRKKKTFVFWNNKWVMVDENWKIEKFFTFKSLFKKRWIWFIYQWHIANVKWIKTKSNFHKNRTLFCVALL